MQLRRSAASLGADRAPPLRTHHGAKSLCQPVVLARPARHRAPPDRARTHKPGQGCARRPRLWPRRASPCKASPRSISCCLPPAAKASLCRHRRVPVQLRERRRQQYCPRRPGDAASLVRYPTASLSAGSIRAPTIRPSYPPRKRRRLSDKPISWVSSSCATSGWVDRSGSRIAMCGPWSQRCRTAAGPRARHRQYRGLAGSSPGYRIVRTSNAQRPAPQRDAGHGRANSAPRFPRSARQWRFRKSRSRMPPRAISSFLSAFL